MLGTSDPVPYPNHWVVYLGGLELSGSGVQFDCYSWGGRWTVSQTEQMFRKCLWGVVTAEP
jgi:hypothetical protein